MLDIVQTILEWFLPIFLPGDEVIHKTSTTASGGVPPQSSLLNNQDSNDPSAGTLVNGLTGTHFLMVGTHIVAFIVVAVWLVISNLTTRVVDQKRSSFRESKSSGSFGLPLHGIIDDNSDRHIWQENFVPSDLKLKWILERHEVDLNHLHKQQIEQDIKVSYLTKKIARQRHDNHPRSLHRKRPDNFFRESNRVTGAHASSEEDIYTFDKYAINENRCRCIKMGKVESEKKETERKGHGDEIGGGRHANDGKYVPSPSNLSFGQGDASQDDQLSTGLRRPGTPDSRQSPRTPQLLHRARGHVTDFFMASKNKPNFIESLLGTEKVAPTPPPRPELPRRFKMTSDNGDLESKLVDRFMTRHPETESAEATASMGSGGSCATVPVNADASQRETAPVPESPSPMDSPGPESAT